MAERWVTVKDAPAYEVSPKGRVRRGAQLLSPFERDGYLWVTLYPNAKSFQRSVGRLVCLSFRGEPPRGKPHAAHKDGDRKNNRLSNLKWKSIKANEADKAKHGTKLEGSRHHQSKLTEEQVKMIKNFKGNNQQLQKELGISKSQFYNIRAGRSRNLLGSS